MGRFNRKFEGDFWDRNPYSSPEKCGLKLLAVIEDPAAFYTFDTVIVVEDVATKAVFVGHDSGCSCPIPFEDHDGLDKFVRIKKIETFDKFVSSQYPDYDRLEVRKARDKIRYRLSALENKAILDKLAE